MNRALADAVTENHRPGLPLNLELDERPAESVLSLAQRLLETNDAVLPEQVVK